MIKQTKGERVFNVFNVIFLTLLSICAFYPMYYVLMASFSQSGQLMAHSGLLLTPAGFSTSAYEVIIDNKNIWTGYGNTLFIVIIGTLVSLALTSMAAYPLSRKTFGARNFFMMMITFTMMFSGGLIPRFLVVKDVGLYDSIWSLILPVVINTTNLIIMRTFFMNLPLELEESAQLDGANDFTIFFRIILPLSKASIATIALFYGVSHWNNWFNAMIYFKNSRSYPLQTILRSIVINSEVTDEIQIDDPLDRVSTEGIKYSTLVVSMVPMMLIYPFVQKYFVKGVMIGSLKG